MTNLHISFILSQEYNERRRLFNLVQELRGNIRVFCRCRPPTATESQRAADSGGAVCVSFPEEGLVKVENDRGKEKVNKYFLVILLKMLILRRERKDPGSMLASRPFDYSVPLYLVCLICASFIELL